jgi:hypothetical protein
MIFGDRITSADTAAPAEWLGLSCRGELGTVGWLVPNHFQSVLHVSAPAPEVADWWSAYRALFDLIASIGQRHTARPDHAWFAIWEGHGFANSTSHIAWNDPPADDAEQAARAAERTRRREEADVRNAAIRQQLSLIPRFERLERSYYVLNGTVDGVTHLRDPSGDGWLNPDLFWPDDRRWFVATDVDFWSLYVGGSVRLIDEVAESVPTPCASVGLDDRLANED